MDLPPVRRLNLLLTRVCNLVCDYCYQGRTARTRASWPVLRERVRELVSRLTLVCVTFSGGEPLLEFGLIEKVVDAAGQSEFGPVAFEWSLITNGLLLDPGRVRWLRDHRFTLQLSVQVDPARAEVIGPSLRGARTVAETGGWRARDTVAITVTPGCGAALVPAILAVAATGAPRIVLAPDLRPGRRAIESSTEWFDRLMEVGRALQHSGSAHPVVNFRPARGPASRGHSCAATDPSIPSVDPEGVVWSCETLIDAVDPNRRASPARAMRLGLPTEPGFVARRRALGDRDDLRAFYTTDPPGLTECHGCEAADSCSVCPATKLKMIEAGLVGPGEFFCGFERAVARVRGARAEIESGS